MVKIDMILEDDEVLEYLFKRNLIKQYDKKKKFILAWFPELADLKLREPKSDKKYYFRINKQFRAIAKMYKEWNQNILYVWEIDDHQG